MGEQHKDGAILSDLYDKLYMAFVDFSFMRDSISNYRNDKNDTTESSFVSSVTMFLNSIRECHETSFAKNIGNPEGVLGEREFLYICSSIHPTPIQLGDKYWISCTGFSKWFVSNSFYMLIFMNGTEFEVTDNSIKGISNWQKKLLGYRLIRKYRFLCNEKDYSLFMALLTKESLHLENHYGFSNNPPTQQIRQRDEWIYDQAMKRIPYPDIARDLQEVFPKEKEIKANRCRQIAGEYAMKNDLPIPAPRKETK